MSKKVPCSGKLKDLLEQDLMEANLQKTGKDFGTSDHTYYTGKADGLYKAIAKITELEVDDD